MISTSERAATRSYAAVRAELALRLAEPSGSEVPACTTRVGVPQELNAAVAADIGGVPSNNVNHLTPRVLDIAAPYERTEARRTTMIDEIQGSAPGSPARRTTSTGSRR